MQKKRTASFCTADLPAVTTTFDDFFHVERSRLATLPRASISYPGSPVGARKMMALPQVDGASEHRRVSSKKKKKKKQAQKKKKNKNKKKSAAAVLASAQVQDAETANEEAESVCKSNEHETGNENKGAVCDDMPAADTDHKDDPTETTNHDTDRPFSPMIMDSPRSSTMQAEDTPSGPTETTDASASVRDDHISKHAGHGAQMHTPAAMNAAVDRPGSTFCRVHGRVCVFHPACCVHKPRPADCTCPAKASCCCLHHAGDCCHCAHAVVAAAMAGNFAAVVHAGNPAAGLAGDLHMHGLAKGDGDKGRAGDKPDAHAPEAGGVCNGDNYQEKQAELEKGAPGAEKGAADKNTPDTLSPIAQHLLRCFERNGHYDLLITLRSSTELFWPMTFRAHSNIVSRSPLVAHFLRATADKVQDGGGGGGSRELVAVAGENFCLPKPFEHVIQHLYGAPLLTAAQLRAQTLGDFGYTEDTYRLTQFCLEAAMTDAAVCYAAAGAFFQLPEVVDRGVQLAVDTISLDNIEVAFWLSLNMAKVAVTMDPTSSVDDCTTTAAAAATTSKKKKRSQTKGAVQRRSDDHDPIRELKDKAVSRLATAALRFVMNGMNAAFVLDVKAHCAGMPDRIPDRLRGHCTATAAETYRSPACSEPMAPNAKLSAVLLALTFSHLRALFAGMGVSRGMTAELAEKIVCERERRRISALKELARQPGVKLEEDAVSEEVRELGYREFYTSKAQLDPEKSGELVTEIALSREWVGLKVREG